MNPDIQNNNVGLLADALDRRTQGIGLAAAGLPDNFFRPNPQFSSTGVRRTCSSSRYSCRSGFGAGTAFGINYTLAKSTDDVSNEAPS